MKYKYVKTNIELTSTEELFKALIDGCILLFKDEDFPEETIETGWTVELINGRLTSNSSIPCLNNPSEWEVWEKVEVNWWEDFKEGDKVICWVSDYDPKVKNYTALIVKVPEEDGDIFASDVSAWKYATPVIKEDLEKFNGKFI